MFLGIVLHALNVVGREGKALEIRSNMLKFIFVNICEPNFSLRILKWAQIIEQFQPNLCNLGIRKQDQP